jgi:hypothetical protein
MRLSGLVQASLSLYCMAHTDLNIPQNIVNDLSIEIGKPYSY